MNCFPCFTSKKEGEEEQQQETADAPVAVDDNNNNVAAAEPSFTPPPPQQVCSTDNRPSSSTDENDNDEPFDADEDVNSAKAFTFRELASAAKNFRQECLIGEGGFGRVFRGTLQSSGQIVAVRKLDRSGTQDSKEFEVDVLMLSLLHHPNLVRLVGYCAEGDQRLLVYEYMPSGPLTKHLFDIPADKKPLHWSARMRIASGIAQGLEYLHEKANPPIIYRDLKSTNILLDETNNPRLSEYGLAKLVQQSGSKMHLSPKTTASGYCAPEYERNGDLTLKSDVYSFGVVLLELISGRRALDPTRPTDEENLVTWAQPIFRDPKRFPDMADPLLKGEFSITSLNQVVGVAAMCLQEEPSVRPMISDIVAALSFLAMAPPNAPIPARLAPILSTRVDTISQPAKLPSLKNNSVSRHKKDDTSDSEEDEEEKDENDQELHPNDDNDEDQNNQNSDQDHTDSSESDTEDDKVGTDPDQNESSKKLKESATWSSSSKRRSKSKSERTLSSTSSSGNGSSIGSIDSSVGFSLRCDSTYPERNFHSESRQDYNSGSSSDEESIHVHNSPNRRLKSMNSRNKDVHNTSKSSSSKRHYSSKKSRDSHSRKYDDMELESDEDDESDFVYSRCSSSAGSEYGEHSPKHEDEPETEH